MIFNPSDLLGDTILGPDRAPSRRIAGHDARVTDVRIGLVTSISQTIDAFFPAWIEEWMAQGNEVHLASGGPNPPASRGTSYTRIRGLGRSPSFGSGRALAAFREWVRRHRISVVLVNTATASWLARAALSDTPVVYFCHGLHWSGRGLSLPYPQLERMALRRTAGVICMNHADEVWFKSYFQGPLLRLPAGVGLELTEWPRRAEAFAQPLQAPRIVWVGEFSRRKRPLDALAVTELLRSRGLDATLQMLGDGPLQDHIRQCATRRPWLSAPGRVAPQAYLRGADMLLSTSEWEGHARVLLEGAATGIPTFGYATKGVEDVPGCISSGTPGDIESLSQSIEIWTLSAQSWNPADRASLDWRVAHGLVDEFIGQVVQG